MTTEDNVHDAATRLARSLADADPSAVIAAAVQTVRPGRLAVVSSFGTESAVLLKLVADVDAAIPVLFLDTGWLFEETLAYRDELVRRLGLRDVRTITPSSSDLQQRDPNRDLYASDPDACCVLRKVEPLALALRDFDAWITGRKRYQGGERQALPAVEVDGGRLKFNPLARTDRADIERIFAASQLPRHPLEVHGFASIGCLPCTSRVAPGEDPRAGRWRGRGKTECGIHQPGLASVQR